MCEFGRTLLRKEGFFRSFNAKFVEQKKKGEILVKKSKKKIKW